MKNIAIIVATMLIGSSAYAGETIVPPITKYVESPLPPKRPSNFGKIDHDKVAQKIDTYTTKKQ